MRYGNPIGLGEVISVLDAKDENIKEIIKQVLHQYNTDPSKKLILALHLWESLGAFSDRKGRGLVACKLQEEKAKSGRIVLCHCKRIR